MSETNTSNEIQIVDFRQLEAYKGAKERQDELVIANPYIEIIDAATFTEAKKRRTALRQGRFDLQNGKKLIDSKITDFRKDVGKETTDLIEITLPHEAKQQTEVERWEAERQREKEEAKLKEQERIDDIKNAIIEFRLKRTDVIKKATLETIVGIIASIDDADLECEEFQQDFEMVKEQLIETAGEKSDQLNEAERVRLRDEEINAERNKLKLERDRFNVLKGFEYIYPKDDLGELTESAYSKVKAKAKKAFEKVVASRKDEKEKATLKKKAGKARSESLKAIDVTLDAETCAGMPEEVWKEFFETKNKAYQAEQNKISLKKKAAKEELERRINAIKAIGFEYKEETQDFIFGNTSFMLQDIMEHSVENFDGEITDGLKDLMAVEMQHLEDLKPDKEKLMDVIKTKLYINPVALELKTADAQAIFESFEVDVNRLKNDYLAKIQNL